MPFSVSVIFGSSPFHASSRKYIDISLPLLLSSSSSFAKRDGRWKSISHSACMQAMMQTEAAKKKSEHASGSASSRMIRPWHQQPAVQTGEHVKSSQGRAPCPGLAKPARKQQKRWCRPR